jgi:hypothetical protein
VVEKYEPQRLKSCIEIYFEEKGWKLIFTPPYMPKFQPIERCWGYCKNGIAEEWKTKRTLAETHDQLLVMWYGGKMGKTGKVRVAITGERTSAWIMQAETDMDEWIKKNGVKCSGVIAELKWDHAKTYSDGQHHNPSDLYDTDDVDDEGV